MLQLNLGAPNQLMPASLPPARARPTRWPKPPTSAIPPFTTQRCGYGYTMNTSTGVCMAQGCYDGRSPCVVVDQYGNSCSYDQLLAYQSHTGVQACGAAAPQLPMAPQVPSVPSPPNVQPGIPVDVSPNPGTQIIATMPANELVPTFSAGIPRWALALGGLAILGVVIALVARR